MTGPLAGYIPLAGVLVVVRWNMVEKKEFASLLRCWPTAMVLIATFGLTIIRDLTTGIIVGCALAALLAFIHRQVPEEGA